MTVVQLESQMWIKTEKIPFSNDVHILAGKSQDNVNLMLQIYIHGLMFHYMHVTT